MGTMGPTTEITAWSAYAVSRIARFSNGVRAIAVTGVGSGTSVFTSADGVAWSQLATYSTSTQNANTPDLFIDQDDNLHLIVCAGGSVYVFSHLLTTPGTNPVSGARTLLSTSFAQATSSASPPRIFAHRNTPGNTTDGWTVSYYYMYQVIRGNGTVYYNPVHVWMGAKNSGYYSTGSAYPLSGDGGSSWFDAVSGWSAELQTVGDGKTPPTGGPRMFFAVHGTPGGATRSGYYIGTGTFTPNATAGQPGSWSYTTTTSNGGSTVGWNGIDLLWNGTQGLIALTYNLGDGSGGVTYYSAVNTFNASGTITGTIWSSSYNTRTTSGSTLTIQGAISIAQDASGVQYAFGATMADTSVLKLLQLASTPTIISAFSPPSGATHTGYPSLRRQGTFGGLDLSWLRYYSSGGTYRTAVANYTTNAAPYVGSKPSGDGTTFDRAQPLTQTYAFTDPDSGDTPSKTDWRWRTSPTSGTPGSWNTVTVTGSSTSITWPANTFPAGRIEVQELPSDSQNVPAPSYSDSAFLTAANAPTALTFSAPPAGSVIPSNSVAATVVADTLDALGWRVLGDTGGAADTSKVISAGDTIEDPTARKFTAYGLANGTTVHLQARRRVNGLWSPWADNGAQAVNFTPPPLPVITITYDSTRGSATEGTMAINYAIPAPGGTEPAVSSLDISLDHGDLDGMHRIATITTPGTAAAINGSLRYWTPAHQRDYGSGTGRVRVTATGANGTTRTATS